ncbi:MAG: type II toxin-antitoxin system PemK/MazF family toxin [Bryobacteraceae bacterium]|jgi:mRNA interferase MazF
MPNRGEIWLADLNPPHGTEPGKTRPVLIVQSQALLDADHPSTYVIPLTTKLVDDAEPLRIRVSAAGRLLRDSDLLLDQLRAIDNRRLIRGPLLRLPASAMKRASQALLELLGIES